MSTVYSASGIAVTADAQDVCISVGKHVCGEYVADQTYRCRVAQGYQHLTPALVGAQLREALTIAVSRNEPFDFRAVLDDIARNRLAAVYDRHSLTIV